MVRWTQPVTAGIHMTIEDDHFVIAATVYNTTGDTQTIGTMDSRLFTLSMKDRTFTEEGTVHRWSPSSGALQAVTHWTLGPNGQATRHYEVPNQEIARQQAREWVEEGLIRLDEDEREFILSDEGQDELDSIVEDYHEFNYVNPADMGVVQVRLGYPVTGNSSASLTRQYDLRSSNHALDAELPPEDLSQINSNMKI